MKTFKEHMLTEGKIRTRRPIVFTMMRANPPTAGHVKVVQRVLNIAKAQKATHEIVLSGTQDSKRNPLKPELKLQHFQKLFPNVNFTVATQVEPGFMNHVQRLHRAGHDHLVVVAGSDRAGEYRDLLKRYAKDLPGFKKTQVLSAGKRDDDAEDWHGISSSKMRDHAKNNDMKEFGKGLPKNTSKEYTERLFNDTRRGMKLKVE
jgi:hypothetical protein